jgi:benzoyl-CoA reductase/2-hydroxyglutaryl-CoA dehydratase subunit BcrC/BadD/HgdB
MAKFVEMDDRVKFKEHIEEKEIDGSIILINKFNVEPDKVEQFVKDWGKNAINFKQHQYLSLHNYIRELERVVYSLFMLFGNR